MTDRQTDRSALRADDHRARSRSQYNKNHIDKTIHHRTCLPQACHLSSHLIPKHVFPCSRPLKPRGREALQNLLTKRVFTRSSQPTQASTKFAEGAIKPTLFLTPVLPRFHCVTCLPWNVRHLEAREPSYPPVENHHTFSRLVLTSYRSRSTREDYSPVFSRIILPAAPQKLL